MYKDSRYINAGTNEYYRWGHKAVEKVEAAMKEHNGYYSIPADGGKYWTFGTSEGKYGEFAKIEGTIFSVNKGGYVYAKADTEKGEKFVSAMRNLINTMNEKHREGCEEE